MQTAIGVREIPTKNVVGYLEGAGPLANETVVIGAHYDHLGRGEKGTKDLGSTAIHYGADDNASGTAALLELARRFGVAQGPRRAGGSCSSPSPPRSRGCSGRCTTATSRRSRSRTRSPC